MQCVTSKVGQNTFLRLKMLKILCHRHVISGDLNGEEIFGKFYEIKLQKKSKSVQGWKSNTRRLGGGGEMWKVSEIYLIMQQ